MQASTQEKQNYKVIPIMISLLLSGFIGMFSETALNVALSDLMTLFHISASTAQRLTTSYLLTLSVLVPILEIVWCGRPRPMDLMYMYRSNNK